MRKILSVFLAMCLMLSALIVNLPNVYAEELESNIWDGTVAKSFASGTGTNDDPYMIETASQLAYFSKAVTVDGLTFSGKCVKLANDIYLNDTSDWETWSKVTPKNVWTPIGTDVNPFKGIFNGNSKTVYGIYVDNAAYAGLFGYIDTAYITRVNIKESYIKSDSSGYAGGVAGYAIGDEVLSLANITNYATVVGNFAGGICGYSGGGTIVMACSNLGDIIGIGTEAFAGGIVGYSWYGGDVSECFNGGSINGKESGGIAGVFVANYKYGYYCNSMGYCSRPLEDLYSTINNCYNYGEVKANECSGGIVGYCSVKSPGFSHVATAERCVQFSYNVGMIEGEGLCGQIIGNTNIDNSDDDKFEIFLNKSYYYNPVASVQYAIGGTSSDSGYAVSLSKEKAMSKESYSNFDFDGTWTMNGNEDYIYPELGAHPHINKHEHNYNMNITTPATHLTTGIMTYTCACGDTYTEVIEKIAEHIHVPVVTAPTCIEQGYTTYTCECGDSYVDDYVDATGHSYALEITTPATHLKTGVMTLTCDCGDTYTEEIEKLREHNFISEVTLPTCKEHGYTTYTCECGENYTRDYVNAVGHTPASAVEENYVAPTCTENGSKDVVVYCSVCGEEISREIVIFEATGHSYTSEITTSATHITEGLMTYTCACGDTYTEVIVKTTEHTYTADVTAPTCDDKGYTTYTCSCGETYVDNYVDATGHVDNNGDGYCDMDNEVLDPTIDCECNCHKSGISKFFFNFILFFQRLFGANKECACGIAHY